MPQYEAIFSGETSSTHKLAHKAAWIVSLSLDETEIEEPDKMAKFAAACVRLSTAADEIDLYNTYILNRHNYEALKHAPEEALTLAKASGLQWHTKKQKDLQGVKSLKNTFSWDDIFKGVDKEALLKIVEQRYQTNPEFQALVDNAAANRMAYITQLAITKKLEYTSAPKMLTKFTAYVLEECAGVLALRLKGYTDAFYLGTLNLATKEIATATFPLNKEVGQDVSDDLLTKINETPLKFHTPSQYKVIAKKNPLPQQRPNGKTLMPQYELHRSTSSGGDLKVLFEAFFGSKEIPLTAKLSFLEKHAGFGSSSSTPTDADAANGENFDTTAVNGHVAANGSGNMPQHTLQPPVEPQTFGLDD